MKKLVVLILMPIVGAGLAAGLLYLRVHAPYRSFTGVEQFVEIPTGVGTKAIGDRLVAAGVIRDHITYRVAVWMSGQARRLKAGEYRFDQPMTPLEVIGQIAR